MKSQSMSRSISMAQRLARRGIPARLVALALAFAFTSSQVSAQPIMVRDAANLGPATASQGSQEAPAGEPAAELSAPIPNVEEPIAGKPFSDSLVLLSSLDAGQNNPQSASTPNAKPAKTKPPHHGLGVALAITGTAALVVGVALLAGSGTSICSNEHSGGCQEARTGGYVGVGVGAPLAVLGFYLQFHR